ncbi:MAG: Flp pilus assembly complex ATPase component TadA [Candidatus Omnitrophica bacterium]|nr:Flp pilus assembly complex ATPase component TadA [Candidatus Omnitrophota bacterium]MDE2214054.1 Flp pilus assembly complex ATPase component TadA [Candidatus Omnitrophota bacterium]MDE2230968.1 Flp pilus assembly complex ATPase component TadA [Candidatus Omnitrophota bacterium]
MDTTQDRILKSLKSLPNINPADIDALVDIQQDKNVSLVKAILKQGLVSEQDLLVLLMRELHIPSIDLTKYRLDDRLKNVIVEKTARQYVVVPLSLLGQTLTVAIADPLNVFIMDDLRNITGKEIEFVIAPASQILKVMDRFYKPAPQVPAFEDSRQASQDFEILPGKEQLQDSQPEKGEPLGGDEAPVIRIVNLIIKEALRQRASDIHMEPQEQGMRVRYRIDGMLQDILTIPKETKNAVTVRIKLMAKMDITNTQTPQDGRFKMKVGRQEVDFRVSMLPTTFGQKIVMRVLDKNNLSVGLSSLGFSTHARELLEASVYKPFGMILVTGPTGSGKSTTLYSLVNKLNTPDKNIITIEEPVEYLVDGLTQIEVRPEIGLNFAVGLRAVLRQSPDVVMVGEIRDAETADIAIKASLTGQLVLSTLHTNSASDAVTRLVDMGLEPFLVASSLIVICAQRLCRRICDFCKKPVDIKPEMLQKISHRLTPGAVLYEGKGCEHCRGTGYKGRVGVTEILLIDDQIRNMLLKRSTSAEIARYAQRNQGMKLLFDDVVDKMLAGETSLAEVFRIASEEE